MPTSVCQLSLVVQVQVPMYGATIETVLPLTVYVPLVVPVLLVFVNELSYPCDDHAVVLSIVTMI